MINQDFKQTLAKLKQEGNLKKAPLQTLEEIELIDGKHPQSILHLKPSQQWTVLIDETGLNFGFDQSVNENSTEEGKIVGLVLPQNHGLEELAGRVHAAEMKLVEVEDLVAKVAKANIGVLGASLKGVLAAGSWMAAIDQYIRLLLRMLPIDTKNHAKVVVKIENRGDYQSTELLLALQDSIINELKLIAPEKFANFHLSLEIMDKNDPFNGYVDVVANCWGSPFPEKHLLLQKAKWPGHCLLAQPGLVDVVRLYQNIHSSELSPADWYLACTHAADEASTSLLNNLLDGLSEKLRGKPALLQAYLGEVRGRIASKNYTAPGLARALNWLVAASGDLKLPANLQLQLLSSNLAAQNHQGKINSQDLTQVLQLAEKLIDEDAPMVVESLNRVAISLTHVFDFSSAQGKIKEWLAKDVAIAGLLNHAKLHSTLGQLQAFGGENQDALASFDKAIESFEKLADPVRAQREIAQTNIYRAIVMMDAKSPETDGLVQEILQKAADKQDFIPRIARSDKPTDRFAHYLLLRWLISRADLSAERTNYLSLRESWANGDGHPWMLIHAYQAWLLFDTDNLANQALAVDLFQQAIDECSLAENGVILHWMAEVLQALALSFGINIVKPEMKFGDNFPLADLELLSSATTNAARLEFLAKALPFNFH